MLLLVTSGFDSLPRTPAAQRKAVWEVGGCSLRGADAEEPEGVGLGDTGHSAKYFRLLAVESNSGPKVGQALQFRKASPEQHLDHKRVYNVT